MITIIPAILATTEDQYQKEIKRINDEPVLEEGWVHVDFADNKLVPNLTVTAEVLEKYPTSLQIEAHLMVEQPSSWVSSLNEKGVKRIIAHIEIGKQELDDFISQCKNLNLEVGLAINMETPQEKIKPYLEVVDLVLVMAIKPGFQGQPFIPESLERIKELALINKTSSKPFVIGIDGHVNDLNVKDIIEAGAEHLVVGSYLLEGEHIDENLEKIWEKINS